MGRYKELSIYEETSVEISPTTTHIITFMPSKPINKIVLKVTKWLKKNTDDTWTSHKALDDSMNKVKEWYPDLTHDQLEKVYSDLEPFVDGYFHQ